MGDLEQVGEQNRSSSASRPDALQWTARRRCANILVVSAAVVTSAVVAWPGAAAVLPACPIHQHFGILCPGCGGTRAIIALLHGDVRDAFRLNGLLVLLLPLGLWFAAESYRRAISHRRYEWPAVSPAIVYGLLVVAGLFGIFRNVG